jgi:hypothetical protein
MPLPVAPIARGTVEVAGEAVAIRSLTRAEALAMRDLSGEDDANRLGEIFLIAHGTDADGVLLARPDPAAVASAEAEAAAWWEASDAPDVQSLVSGIAILSRLLVKREADGKAPNPTQPASRPSGRSSKGR